jgi:hypothetical protein
MSTAAIWRHDLFLRHPRFRWDDEERIEQGWTMKVSFFETGRYQTPVPLPAEWPAAPANYSPEAGNKAYQTMIERLEYVESIGFD